MENILRAYGDATHFLLTGVGIVFVTHVYMLVMGMPESQMMAHAVLNLVAALAITFGRRA